MFAAQFIRSALLAGCTVAVASGVVGYFVVLRSQVFAGDTLSHVAFTGALAGAAAGLDLRAGLFAVTVLVALLLAALGARAQPDDVTIGVVFAWVLGLGVLFLDLFNSGSGGGDGTIAARALFGSIFGLSPGAARLAAVIAVGVVIATLAIGRPLLLASLDPAGASARGLRVRLLGTIFLVVVVARRGRGHAGRGRAAAARAAGRAGGRGAPADREPLPRDRAVGADRAGLHVRRDHARLPGAVAAAEQRDHRARVRRLSARVAGRARRSRAARLTGARP